jgi:CheY-like chemotaxis protein
MGDEDTWPGATRPPVRILLVDDSDEFRRQAARYLAAAPGCRVEAFASSGEEAIEVEKKVAPDLVLMDLVMPGIDGFEAARRIRSRRGAGRVVIMTLDAAPFRKAVAERSLADGLISKTQFVREFEQVLARLFPPPSENAL